MVIFNTKKDIAAYVTVAPVVLEAKRSWGEGDPTTFNEATKELARLIAVGEGSPDFGEDWEEWLAKNIEELFEEAISIVM